MNNKLAVIFPGVGYHTDKPLLYYSKKLARENGYEIIEVSYQNIEMKRDSDEAKKTEEFFKAFAQAKEILNSIDFDSYEEILFIAKSVGTIVATGYAKEKGLKTRNILYTPIEKAFEFLDTSSEAIAFTGTKDPWVTFENIKKSCEQLNVSLYITDEGNHSLETGDPSIDVQNLVTIMEYTKQYIQKTTMRAAEIESAEADKQGTDNIACDGNGRFESDNDDAKYMRRAIELAKRAVGHTNPNPMVGAVIVKDGRIIGEGYHKQIGGLHAERNAIASLTESAEGATIYVTLEPCCHYGKTPPCTEAIIENKLAKVVIGSRDPNPLVSGKGVQLLREAGIEVVEDYLREECDAINPVFFKYIQEQKPYVAIKYAMTADGRIGTSCGKSQWITGEKARNHVHQLRNYYPAIMVGYGTVIADDPMLTCRLDAPINDDYGDEKNASGGYGRNPIRIVCDTHLKTSLDSKLVNSTDQGRVIIACICEDYTLEYFRDFEEKGVEILFVEEKDGKLDVNDLMMKLGKKGIDGILVEGGGMIHGSLVDEGLVDYVYAYVGPKVFGGTHGNNPVAGKGVLQVANSMQLANPIIHQFGDDFMIEYEVVQHKRDDFND